MSWDAQPPSEPAQPDQPTGYDQYGQPILPQQAPQHPTQAFPPPYPTQPPHPTQPHPTQPHPTQAFPQQQDTPQWYAPQPDPSQWQATQQWDATQGNPGAANPSPWGQPQYQAGPPFFGAPPLGTAQPPKRSRTGLYVGLGAGAVLVAGVVAAVVAMSGGSPTTPAAQNGPTATATPASGSSTPNNAADPSPTGADTAGSQTSHTLIIPVTAGPLHLVVNGDTQQRISDLKKNLQSNSAYPDPQVGFYRVGSAGSFSVWLLAESTANLADFQTSLGIMGPTGVMKQITDGASMTNVTVENPGALGGALDCGKLNVDGTTVRSCVWVDHDSFGWVYFLPSVSQSKMVTYTLDLRAAVEH
ncbi:MAG TPA: hypothetical protein VFA06_02850 [Actinocrinis sp.]|uniref:hypothetical protein n=1 Tax=Actinocrinis sp. TaxID=1920516 RepID=UPI002D451804|nr:hypothetical protein [Actinocrinis sp.]HZU54786.1 hypothetical protein [Actinocrinis sp.]